MSLMLTMMRVISLPQDLICVNGLCIQRRQGKIIIGLAYRPVNKSAGWTRCDRNRWLTRWRLGLRRSSPITKENEVLIHLPTDEIGKWQNIQEHPCRISWYGSIGSRLTLSLTILLTSSIRRELPDKSKLMRVIVRPPTIPDVGL